MTVDLDLQMKAVEAQILKLQGRLELLAEIKQAGGAIVLPEREAGQGPDAPSVREANSQR